MKYTKYIEIVNENRSFDKIWMEFPAKFKEKDIYRAHLLFQYMPGLGVIRIASTGHENCYLIIAKNFFRSLPLSQDKQKFLNTVLGEVHFCPYGQLTTENYIEIIKELEQGFCLFEFYGY